MCTSADERWISLVTCSSTDSLTGDIVGMVYHSLSARVSIAFPNLGKPCSMHFACIICGCRVLYMSLFRSIDVKTSVTLFMGGSRNIERGWTGTEVVISCIIVLLQGHMSF